MKKLMMMLLFCHVASAVKHSMKFYLMVSSGVPNVPDYVAVANVEEVIMAYYDSDMKTPEPRQDWVRELIEDDPQDWERNAQGYMRYQQLFKAETDSFTQHLNQTAGVHINQQILGCEWDDETKKVDGYKQYGYNGEDFLTFDLETETWIAANPQAEITKQEWDGNKASNGFWKNFLSNVCPVWLKDYVNYGKSLLQRTELPSVSLLQKTPSSPVSCHATGFYPDRASLFWRKDGEELHEDVDHGEILPNNDGTFQMSVDLNLSSVTPEDWRRYDCVFQLSGVEDDIVTGLDKAAIRTNWGKTGIRSNEEEPEEPSNITIPITAAVVVLAVVLIAAIGFTVYKKRKANRPPPPPDNSSELSDKLNPQR
ncbi:major histocompatibility complex class I-related gene protein-like [Enoplosus armatus]|uniref:major histocompatibility complex class I-related gene protein-like n=1 Tax=Enoplosus armatus TaxID=215367 RepID=UPI003992151F